MKVKFVTGASAAWAPPPVPASSAMPDWLKAMPLDVPNPADEGWRMSTPRRCPPFVDAMLTGWVMRLPVALRVVVTDDQQVKFGSRPEVPWRPVGRHAPAQTDGSPLEPVYRFEMPYAVVLPKGWSLLYTHPLNRVDLPFYTLAGVVDDGYDSPVNLPFVWTDWQPGDFLLDAGTPVAQLVPIRRERWESELEVVDDVEMFQASSGAASNVDGYRKLYRRPKVYR